MFYGWLLAENFTVLGYSLKAEKTMRGANSVPTYTGVPGVWLFSHTLQLDPAAARMRVSRKRLTDRLFWLYNVFIVTRKGRLYK